MLNVGPMPDGRNEPRQRRRLEVLASRGTGSLTAQTDSPPMDSIVALELDGSATDLESL